ncbi:MAG: SDR family NAD(P)-dependent oxidoreductase [Propionibacteriaceae bacterium]
MTAKPPEVPRLLGRRVAVTGATGIAAAAAALVVGLGGRVHVIDRDPAQAATLAAVLDGTSSVADLSDDAATERAFAEASAALSGLDGLVAVAGGSARRQGDGAVAELTRDALSAAYSANLVPATLALAAFLRHRDPAAPGAAVLVSSVLARHPASPLFVTHGYAAMKAAIEGLVYSSAAHYATAGVTINAVAPGLTRTPMSQRAQQDPAVSAYAAARQPLTEDGFLDPEDVADAACWLLGAGRVTGQVITVDGGWSVHG